MKTLNLKISGMASVHCVGVVKNIIVKERPLSRELKRWNLKTANKLS